MTVAQSVRSFLEDEAGAELVEWAVATLILLVATAAVLLSIQGRIADILTGILQKLESDPNLGALVSHRRSF